MKADAISAKILDDARAAAAQTLAEANRRVEAIRESAEAETQRKREQAMAQAKRECGELRDRMLRMAELDQRKLMLGAKREMIARVFDGALEQMRAMPDKDKLDFIGRLLLASASGDEWVIPAVEDAHLYTPQLIARVNAQLIRAGKAGGLRLTDQARPLDGGFVLKRGGMEVNCTFRAVLNERRASLEASACEMLFN